MGNIFNALSLGDGYNITAQMPLDSRVCVQKVSDLTADDSWGDTHIPYSGMIVSVIETGDIYVLLDDSNPHDPNNWKKQSSGSSSNVPSFVLLTQEEYNSLEDIDNNTIYYIYENGN